MATSPRARRLWTCYRLTEPEYDAILSHQNDACAACKRTGKGIRLSVDHSHATGLIRGLLCWTCNKALGLMRDDPQTALNLAAYLTSPPAPTALGKEVYGLLGRAIPGKKVKRYGPS